MIVDTDLGRSAQDRDSLVMRLFEQLDRAMESLEYCRFSDEVLVEAGRTYLDYNFLE